MGFGSLIVEMGQTNDEDTKVLDEIEDYSVFIHKKFYVLKSLKEYEGVNFAVKLKDLSKQLQLGDLQGKTTPDLAQEVVYIETDGNYYPDYIEEQGVFLFSQRFVQYLKRKINIRDFTVKKVGLVSENGKRVEEYSLIIPDELDCILKGTAQIDKNGGLSYFEIDEKKTGKLQIFRVKGFPHLIVTKKLNRIDFAGFTCSKIENFCDYEGERDRQYLSRLNGKFKENARKFFEIAAQNLHKDSVVYRMSQFLDEKRLKQEIVAGFKRVFDSFYGTSFDTKTIADRFLLFVFCWDDGSIKLAADYRQQFARTEFVLISLAEVKELIFSVCSIIDSVLRLAIWAFSRPISFLNDFHSVKNLSEVLGSWVASTLYTAALSFKRASFFCMDSTAASPAENSRRSTPS